MPFFNSGNATIHYETFGDASKPALIFSNSLGTNFSMWQPQIDHFKSQYYVICYDTRGHGESNSPQGPYLLQDLGLDVIQLLDVLNINKAHFCGISMGGLTGQWLAIHNPERFSSVVICNTAAKIGTEQAWLDRAKLVRTQGLKSIAETAASRWFTENFIQNRNVVVENLTRNLANGSAEGYASCCEALAQADLRTDIAEIKIPVLIIAGQKDPVTTVEDGGFMQQKIQNSQLFEINASHISNLEQSGTFNQKLKTFIDS